MQYASLAVLAVSIGIGFLASSPSPAQVRPRGNIAEGKKLFHDNCSSCHGVDGKGNGSMYDPNAGEASRRIPPADLTVLRARNGGKFPVDYVRASVYSKDLPAAHGTPDMPAWGDVFDNLKSEPQRLEQHLRGLTAYIESIQEPKK